MKDGCWGEEGRKNSRLHLYSQGWRAVASLFAFACPHVWRRRIWDCKYYADGNLLVLLLLLRVQLCKSDAEISSFHASVSFIFFVMRTLLRLRKLKEPVLMLVYNMFFETLYNCFRAIKEVSWIFEEISTSLSLSLWVWNLGKFALKLAVEFW